MGSASQGPLPVFFDPRICGGQLDGPPLEKSALKRGDVLVLTKPLGLGVLLAGEMRHRTRGSWLEGALAVMDQSNGPATPSFARTAERVAPM